MAEREKQALEYMRQKQWAQASQIYDQILGSSVNLKASREKNVSWLANRSECNAELNRHDGVIQDCRKLLNIINDTENGNIGTTIHKRLVHSLFKSKKYNEAEQACRDWIKALNNSHSNPEISKTGERIRSVLQTASGQRNNQRLSQQNIEDELNSLVSKLDSFTMSSSGDKNKKVILTNNSKNASGDHTTQGNKKRNQNQNDGHKSEVNNFEKQIEQVGKGGSGDSITCSYCSLGFNDKAALRAHCSTHEHQTIIMSDEGRDWKWRPPPRGFTSDTYALCESYETNGNVSSMEGVTCRYGAQCVEAHGIEELAEWKERFEYRKMKMQRACEKELYGKSYTEQLLEKWIQAPSPEKVMKEKIDSVEETCSADLVTTVSSKVSKREWTFVLKTKRLLKAVALLQDAHRNHFVLKQVFPGEPKINKKGKDGHKVVEADLTSDQEWTSAYLDKAIEPSEQGPTLEHRIKVVFSTDIYGTFRQSVVFDFGSEPVLVKHLCVDVVPVTDADKIQEIRKEMILSVSERWDTSNTEIIPFSSPVYPGLSTPYGSETCERDRELLNAYPAPRANNLCLTQSTVTEKYLTKNNYRTRMHELLYVEEMARYEQVARYNVTCKLRVAPSYLLAPSGMATSTAKYAHSGELFALLTLGKDVSEDTSAGRLILNNCTTVLLSASPAPTVSGKRRVYEALIEDKGKNMIYLRLSAIAVRELSMRADSDFLADVQFQLNRVTYCEWHHAIDKISDYKLIFPDTVLDEPTIPWSPYRQWNQMLDPKLNAKQKEAVIAITSPVGTPIPPILIIGPFGTGKTYTLAQAIKLLIHQPDTKILICTHSNSAADLYIKDYLHPWLEAGVTEAKPLRVYYHKRWVTTVDQVVQKYCLIELNNGVRNFRLPTIEDIKKHRIVVVTLSISMYLSSLGLPKGYFTHILLDEAAQAMESEALMPLALATPTSRIVLAGDHMQLSPELFSQFAKERNLHVSLLERLYEHYPSNFPCKILLCENYRAHEAIISFTSELFYDQKLIASGKQPRHEKFYPLTFFTTRGEDVQDQNSTAFYNNSEVYEVIERICELRRRWPSAWGKLDEQSIGIMTPYADQVFRIRSELRKRRMGGISVERVLNVQGKQFRAVFLSTVRTRRTCQAASELDYGFLSNRKLLNTAITRAQSLVAVVGDPVALCSIGRCRKVWERFIEICNDNKSLFGITWTLLRSQLDGVEFKKTYTLNPLAPEFVPRALQPEAYIKFQSSPMVGPPLVQLNIMPPMTMPITQNTNIRPQQQQPQQQPQQQQQQQQQQNAAQVQPIINTSNPPPMVPYPLYYFPGNNPQQAPPAPNVFPITCPPPPTGQPPPPTQNMVPNVPITYPPPPTGPVNQTINPWNVNSMSMASPNGRSTPTWALKQAAAAAAQKKPNDIIPQINITNQRLIHPNLVPNRTSIIPQHLINHQNITTQNLPPQNMLPQNIPLQNMAPIKNQQYPLTQLPLRPQPGISPNASPLPTGFVPDNFIPSELNTQSFFRSMNNPPPERIPYPPNMNKIQEPVRQVAGLMSQDKEQIQFLQNVHFPERGALPSQRDIQPILPPHVTLQDICNEGQEAQLQWYHHLLDTQGIESANKFMELVLQRTLPQPKPNAQHLPQQADQFIHVNDLSRNFDDLFSDKIPPTIQSLSNFNIPNGHGPGISNDNDRSWQIPEPKPPIINQYVNSKPYPRDFDSSLLFGNNVFHQNMNPKEEKLLQIRNIQNTDPSMSIDLPWQTTNTQSVPLYRRQAGQANPMNNANEAALVNSHGLLDTLDKQNTSSGAFAGYARAFSLQQNDPPHGVQHNNIAVNDRIMMNGNINMNMIDCRIPMPNNMVQQQRMQHHMNAEFPRPMNGLPMDHMEDSTTYASVLRQNTPKLEDDKNDPFGLLRDFGHKPQAHGLYNYFD